MRPDKQRENSSVVEASAEEEERESALVSQEEGSEPQADAPNASTYNQRHSTFGAWLHRLSERRPSLVLENKGSVARDHLAAERTFLAYVRTALGCAAVGVALMQLLSMTPTDVSRPLDDLAKVLGALTELLGVGIIFIAVTRYFTMQKALIDNKFPPAGMVIWTIVFSISVITVLTFGLMLAIALS